MNAKEAATQYRMKEWAAIIQDRADSGLTIDKYCEQRGISKNSYYYWLKAIRKKLISEVPAAVGDVPPAPITFQELATPSQVTSVQDSITIGIKGMSIIVTKDTSMELLLRVLEVAQHVK